MRKTEYQNNRVIDLIVLDMKMKLDIMGTAVLNSFSWLKIENNGVHQPKDDNNGD
jgi:hypothetical protein